MKVVIVLLASVLIVGCSSTGKNVVDGAIAGGEGSLSAQFDQGNLQPVMNPRGSDSGEIQGLETVRFGYDRASLNSASRRALQQNADWIRGNSYIIQIEGHCDNRGSSEYNLALGSRRAEAVKGYLMDLGIPADRLRTVSYGEELPVQEGDSESVFSKNRRANFIPAR